MNPCKSLLEQIYSVRECEIIKDLFINDESCRSSIQFAIGDKLSLSTDTIVHGSALNVIFLICSATRFASSDESNRVALIIYNFINVVDPFPSLAEHSGMEFAERTFISACFFKPYMLERTKRYGYPSIEFYKKAAKCIFDTHDYEDVSLHFELWENYLQERFI